MINDQTYTDSKDIAFKLNEFFASVCDQFSFGNDPADHPDLNKLKTYVKSEVPSHVNFTVTYITPEEVNAFLHALDPTKATGIEGRGPRNLKWRQKFCHRRLPHSSTKAFKRLHSRLILRQQKFFPYIRVDRNLTQQVIDPFLFCQQY